MVGAAAEPVAPGAPETLGELDTLGALEPEDPSETVGAVVRACWTPQAITTNEETITAAKHFAWVRIATYVSRLAGIGSFRWRAVVAETDCACGQETSGSTTDLWQS
ncbi:MAG TPA: hypothetical protein VFU02_15770 [Polyangiaceae bacterium]|nr:hypothetical protein [Polyangiaceae bacterium]